MAKMCEKLDVFVHVSTAYVNCDDLNATPEGRTVPEMIRHKNINPEKIVEYIKNKDEKYIIEHTNEMIKPYPNTYTFTKDLSERLLQKNRGDMPMVIIRPSIVGAAYNCDPHIGWVDNLAALSGFIFIYGIGLLNMAPGKFSNSANFIPVDYVVNMIITSAVF
jgi:hypothetical protein